MHTDIFHISHQTIDNIADVLFTIRLVDNAGKFNHYSINFYQGYQI